MFKLQIDDLHNPADQNCGDIDMKFFSNYSIPGEVSLKDFHNTCVLKTQHNGYGFEEDLKYLYGLCCTHLRTVSYNISDCDREKNRYLDVLPNSHTRVKLKIENEHDNSSDYINANHINTHLKGNTIHYIASQAPTKPAFNDFWKMISQQNINLILMLTKENENGRLKCDPYWPESTEEACIFSYLIVKLVDKKYLSPVLIQRQFKVTDTIKDTVITVNQLQYLDWPDYGSPPIQSFLELFTHYRNLRDSNHPVLAHCSAGIGRTGSFIVVDSILDLIKYYQSNNLSSDSTIHILKLVFNLRVQRAGMVQTKGQYEFCYIFIDHCLQSGLLGITSI